MSSMNRVSIELLNLNGSKQVQTVVNKIASGLTKLDFGKGDVICMFCSNYVDYWLIVLAAW